MSTAIYKKKKFLIPIISTLVVLIAAVILFFLSYQALGSYNETLVNEIQGQKYASIVEKTMTDKTTKCKLVAGFIVFLRKDPIHFVRNFETNAAESLILKAFKSDSCDTTAEMGDAFEYYCKETPTSTYEVYNFQKKKIDLFENASWLVTIGSWFLSDYDIFKYQAFFDEMFAHKPVPEKSHFDIFNLEKSESIQRVSVTVPEIKNQKIVFDKGEIHTFEKSAYNVLAYLLDKSSIELTKNDMDELKKQEDDEKKGAVTN